MEQQRIMKQLAKFGGYWTSAYGAKNYFVSIDGKIVSVIGKNIRLLKPIKCGLYDGVQLSHNDCVIRKVYIHRLMLSSWDMPALPEQQCRHLDGNRVNNALVNLQWGSKAENERDRVLHGTSAVGTKNPQSKLTDSSVKHLRALRKESAWSYKRLGNYFGVSTMTAYRAVTGQAWSHL